MTINLNRKWDDYSSFQSIVHSVHYLIDVVLLYYGLEVMYRYNE